MDTTHLERYGRDGDAFLRRVVLLRSRDMGQIVEPQLSANLMNGIITGHQAKQKFVISLLTLKLLWLWLRRPNT